MAGSLHSGKARSFRHLKCQIAPPRRERQIRKTQPSYTPFDGLSHTTARPMGLSILLEQDDIDPAAG